MDIDTGDSPPVCQKPYSLPLKHVEWVQKELDISERAGVIQRSMSPWASPIVIVPKKSEPGEPPRRRMCVDYRMLNSLLPPVNKAHSKAKGIVTLVPLPKIDEIYAQLQGSKIFSALDMRSGYFHIEFSEEAKPKTAFVPGGPHGSKYQFNRCPFGLSQAPAYFQRLVHEVLRGLPFTFGYLDDILIFSSGVEAHLKHLQKVFLRLREAKLKLKGMVEMLPALPPMNYDNLNRRIGELDDYPLEIPVAIIAIVLVVSTVFLVATLVVYAYIIFRLRKNIKILFPMAKLLTGRATGSEAQEIKRMLLTLLEIPAGQHCPPPLPLRPTRLAITPAEVTSAQTISSTGATVVVKDKIELLTTPKQIKRYEKYLWKQKEKLQEDTKL